MKRIFLIMPLLILSSTSWAEKDCFKEYECDVRACINNYPDSSGDIEGYRKCKSNAVKNRDQCEGKGIKIKVEDPGKIKRTNLNRDNV